MDKYNLKDRTILIEDYGGFTYLVEVFAKYFGTVLYYSPYESEFARSQPFIVGTGIPNVTRIDNVDDYEDNVDLFFFTDLHKGARQNRLRSAGKAVFGSGKVQDIELYRTKLKTLLKDLELPVNKYEVSHGFSDLKKKLKGKKDVWVKSDFFRGDSETFRYEDDECGIDALMDLERDLGINKENEDFIIEEPIKDAVEYGYDGFVTTSGFPSKTIFGVEVKDSSYAAVFTDYDRLPKTTREANEKLLPIFISENYNGWYSSEERCTKKDFSYYLDITARLGEPPTSLACEMFKDYPVYCWEVANGIVPNIESKAKYGVQLIIKSDRAIDHPQRIFFPKKYKDFVKVKSLHIDEEGNSVFVPQNTGMTEIGAIVYYGNTLKEAKEGVIKIAKEVRGYGLKINLSALDEADSVVANLKKYGINIF